MNKCPDDHTNGNLFVLSKLKLNKEKTTCHIARISLAAKSSRHSPTLPLRTDGLAIKSRLYLEYAVVWCPAFVQLEREPENWV